MLWISVLKCEGVLLNWNSNKLTTYGDLDLPHCNIQIKVLSNDLLHKSHTNVIWRSLDFDYLLKKSNYFFRFKSTIKRLKFVYSQYLSTKKKYWKLYILPLPLDFPSMTAQSGRNVFGSGTVSLLYSPRSRCINLSASLYSNLFQKHPN